MPDTPLAEQTKRLAGQTERLAEQTEKVAEETRSGAQAMHAQLDAIEVPFVVPVPNPNLRTKGHRESLDVVLPIHRVLRDGMRYVELRFINVGSGPAIVKSAQITTRSGDVKLLFEPIDHIPIAANESVDATLLTTNTWAPNPSPLTFSVDYTAPDGRSYRTRGVAQLDGDGESIRCLTFERITEEEWESGI